MTHGEGLSQTEEEDVLITEEGEIVPRNVYERMAAENEVVSDDSLAQRSESQGQCFEEEQEEAEVKSKEGAERADERGKNKARSNTPTLQVMVSGVRERERQEHTSS